MDETSAESLPALLSAAMDRRGIAQWKLARHMRRSRAAVSRWLSGDQGMPPEIVLEAARYLAAPELEDALIARHPWVQTLIRARTAPVDLALARQVRAMRSEVPVQVRGVMVVSPGRIEFVPDPDPAGPATVMLLRSA